MTKTTKEQRNELRQMISEVGAYRTINSRDGYPVSDILSDLLSDAERCAELEDAIMDEIQMRTADPETMYGAWRAAYDRVEKMEAALVEIAGIDIYNTVDLSPLTATQLRNIITDTARHAAETLEREQ
jgi:hypothetical protein